MRTNYLLLGDCRGCSPLDEAEDVDPEEAAGGDIHHAEAGGDQQEVDSLGRHPEQARGLECGHKLLPEVTRLETENFRLGHFPARSRRDVSCLQDLNQIFNVKRESGVSG